MRRGVNVVGRGSPPSSTLFRDTTRAVRDSTVLFGDATRVVARSGIVRGDASRAHRDHRARKGDKYIFSPGKNVLIPFFNPVHDAFDYYAMIAASPTGMKQGRPCQVRNSFCIALYGGVVSIMFGNSASGIRKPSGGVRSFFAARTVGRSFTTEYVGHQQTFANRRRGTNPI
jgi:hypothetical protein